MKPNATDWAALQSTIAGDVLLPGSPEYERARKPANIRFHAIQPQAIVRCGGPADVVETIAFAARSGQTIVPRSGGHCFAGRSSTSGIVVDVTPMRTMSVSGDVAVVGAGARLEDVYESLAEHDVTIPAGCGPTVGIAGLTLGGGLGILGRRYGLTCDRLLAAEVVLADGRVVECDDRHDADLFWALRGAGSGNFGIVTSLQFRTVPVPTLTSFALDWGYAHIARVIEAWQTWAPAAPDELAASLLVTVSGQIDQHPTAHVFGAWQGVESTAADVLNEFVDLVGVDPLSTVMTHVTHRAAKRYLAELGSQIAGTGQPGQELSYSKSEFFSQPLPTAAIAQLVNAFTHLRRPGQARELDFTPWGGAYNRVPIDATAFAHRTQSFLLKQAVVVPVDTPAGEQEAARRWLARSWESVHPWGSGGVYPNFPDLDLTDWAQAYYGPNYSRLVNIKAAYDPDGFFRSPQAIPAELRPK